MTDDAHTHTIFTSLCNRNFPHFKHRHPRANTFFRADTVVSYHATHQSTGFRRKESGFFRFPTTENQQQKKMASQLAASGVKGKKESKETELSEAKYFNGAALPDFFKHPC